MDTSDEIAGYLREYRDSLARWHHRPRRHAVLPVEAAAA